MNAFKVLLVVLCAIVLVFTVMAVTNEGTNLFATTLPSVPEFGWPAQFYVDFATYLVLSALWVAWRHEFSASGIILGVLASQLGMIFLSLYLLYILNQAEGDMHVVLLGEGRVKRA